MELPNWAWRAGYTDETYAARVRKIRAAKLALAIVLLLAVIKLLYA